MANAVTSNGYEPGGGSISRAPRLPRWTRQEILVLIQGKRVIEGRGRRRTKVNSTVSGTPESSTTTTGALEPKWAAVSAYCLRHGVERGAVQCRKRWSNLAGDFKKIKEWEKEHGGGKESFWAMRNDLRRERKLPGFFYKEVYDILDGVATLPPMVPVIVRDEDEEDTTVVFDSGRTATEDGLFSDGEEEKDPEEDDEATEDDRLPSLPASVVVRSTEASAAAVQSQPVVVVPISEKKYEPFQHETSAATADPGMASRKQFATGNPEKESFSNQDGQHSQKPPRATAEHYSGDCSSVQQQLIQVLESNSRLIAAQLEVQNLNCQLDRDQRKEQAEGILNSLGKLADALGRIAEKL